jgi:hypothetical protein
MSAVVQGSEEDARRPASYSMPFSLNDAPTFALVDAEEKRVNWEQ